MAVTIKDIAREADVSFSTVSSVLRSPDFAGGRASAETRARIVAVANRLNYQPSNIGRGLRTGKSRLIAFLSPTFEAALTMKTMIGAETVCHRNDYNVVLGTFDSPASYRALLESLLRKHVDGVLVPMVTETAYRDVFDTFSRKLPMVNLFGSAAPHCPGVFVNGADIGRIGAEYLLGLGHRKILLTGARPASCEAFKECFRAAGLPDDHLLHWPEFVSLEDGKEAMKRLIELHMPVTAVFAYNDDNAAGFLQEAVLRGVRIPQQLSVLGVNNSAVCDMLAPPLCTVAQPQREQGEQAAETLLSMIAGAPACGSIILTPYLVQRASCALYKPTE